MQPYGLKQVVELIATVLSLGVAIMATLQWVHRGPVVDYALWLARAQDGDLY